MRILAKIFYLNLILNIFLVQSSEIFTAEFTAMQNQLFSDVFELKTGLGRIKMSAEIFNKRHSLQLNDLKDVLNSCPEDKNDSDILENSEDKCDEELFFVNETIKKYDQFSNKLLEKLAETQKTETQNLDEILRIKTLERECQDVNSKVLATTTNFLLSQLEVKVNDLEQQLKQFENLEEHFSLQQKYYEKQNEDQMKILKKIMEKLQQNEDNFVKYQKEAPDMNNFSNKINNLVSWRLWRHRHGPRQ